MRLDVRPLARTWDISLSTCPRSLNATFTSRARWSGGSANCTRCSAEPEVRAILCARGGYGCNYLLPHLDLELIGANPKIFAGCSDVTTLLTYLCDHAGLVTFHAPMVAGDFSRPDGIDVDAWSAAVSSGKAYPRTFSQAEVQPLVEGSAEGVLYGGCLSLLCASLGTPYEIHTEGSILFLEDRGEKPYQIDRMLMQLKLAGKFDGSRGNYLWRDARLWSTRRCGPDASRSHHPYSGRAWNPNRVRAEVRPRFQQEFYATLRRRSHTQCQHKMSY